jgi:hypothetical protein
MSTDTVDRLLTEVHEIDFPALYSPTLATKEREASVKLAKQKLKLIKRQLRDEMDVIKKQWDGRNSNEAHQEKLNLAPYKVLDDLVAKLEVALAEVEIKGTSAKPVTFGNVLVGDFDKGEWHIVTEKEAVRWLANFYKNAISETERLMAVAEA